MNSSISVFSSEIEFWLIWELGLKSAYLVMKFVNLSFILWQLLIIWSPFCKNLSQSKYSWSYLATRDTWSFGSLSKFCSHRKIFFRFSISLVNFLCFWNLSLKEASKSSLIFSIDFLIFILLHSIDFFSHRI